MSIKVKKSLFILLLISLVYTIIPPLQADLNIDDMNRASEIRKYYTVENINSIPVEVKIEQMLYLGFNLDNLNNDTIQYLNQHNIGGITLNADLNQQTRPIIARFLQKVIVENISIPAFFDLNSIALKQNLDTVLEYLPVLFQLGINTNKVPWELLKNEIAQEARGNSAYIRQSKRQKIITIIDDYKFISKDDSNFNTSLPLVWQRLFTQMLIPSNDLDEAVDPVYPYSISPAALQSKIRVGQRFSGIIVNNILSDKNILLNSRLSEVLIQAIKAGNNMIFFNGGNLAQNRKFVSEAVQIIKRAIADGIITIDDINTSYVKIINLKKQFDIIMKEIVC